MHYTQDLGSHADKVYRNLDLRANDVTAIVTGVKNKQRRGGGSGQQTKEEDLIVIPPLHVKYGTFHQQRREGRGKGKSSSRRRRGTVSKSDNSGITKGTYLPEAGGATILPEFGGAKRIYRTTSDVVVYLSIYIWCGS